MPSLPATSAARTETRVFQGAGTFSTWVGIFSTQVENVPWPSLMPVREAAARACWAMTASGTPPLSAVMLLNLHADQRGLPKAFNKLALLPVWKTYKEIAAQHPLLCHLTETQIQERVLHACLDKVFLQAHHYCVEGVLSRDCNGIECHVHTVLAQYVADLKEEQLLLSLPHMVSAHPCCTRAPRVVTVPRPG